MASQRPRSKRKSVTNILLAFYPVGAVYPIYDVSVSVLDKLGPELVRLLDPRSGVQHLDGAARCAYLLKEGVAEGKPVRIVPGPEGSTPPARKELRDVLSGDFPISVLSPWGLGSALVVVLRSVYRLLRRMVRNV